MQNVSTESKVLNGLIETNGSSRTKFSRSKDAGIRQTNSDGMVRIDEQRNEGNEYCVSPRIAKTLKFDGEYLEKVTQRNGDDEKRFDEPSESVPTGKVMRIELL